MARRRGALRRPNRDGRRRPRRALEILRREPILGGKAFGGAGSYEKLVGKVHFALDPKLAINASIVDLDLAPRDARGEVESPRTFSS